MTVKKISRCRSLLALLAATVAMAAQAQAQVPAPATPAATPKNLNTELTDMVERWTGDYRETNANGVTIRWAAVRQIEVPGLAPLAMYIEVHQAVPVDKIIYQRILGFDQSEARTRNWANTYYFANPEDNQQIDRKPERLKKLGPGDLLAYPPGPGACELNLSQESGNFTLTTHKDVCRVASVAPGGQAYHPELKISIAKDSFSYSQENFRDSGESYAPVLQYRMKKLNAALRRE